MKTIFTFVLLLLLTNSAFSQDLIVTNDGDSINCKITKVRSGNIYFTFRHENETRNTLLPLSRVKDHQTGFYETSEIPKGEGGSFKDYTHFRIAVNGGYSYQIAKVAANIPADFKDYVRKLKSGYHVGGDVTYYFSEPLGFGVRYYLFKSTNQLDEIYVEDNSGNRTYGTMSDDLAITFIGPSFSTRMFNYDKSNAFLANLSLGYMGYSNDRILIDPYKMTGSTLGLALDLGYDIGLSKSLSLGFQISLLTGTLFQYNLNDGSTTQTIKLEKGEYESLNRIDLSIGLRFNK